MPRGGPPLRENAKESVMTLRATGTNPRSLGVNPRALGLNPKALLSKVTKLRQLVVELLRLLENRDLEYYEKTAAIDLIAKQMLHIIDDRAAPRRSRSRRT